MLSRGGKLWIEVGALIRVNPLRSKVNSCSRPRVSSVNMAYGSSMSACRAEVSSHTASGFRRCVSDNVVAPWSSVEPAQALSSGGLLLATRHSHDHPETCCKRHVISRRMTKYHPVGKQGSVQVGTTTCGKIHPHAALDATIHANGREQ